MKNYLVLALFALVCNIVTAQTGIDWGTSVDIAPSSFGGQHPRIVVDASGNPIVIWTRSGDESLMFARWNGTGFTAPVKLNDGLTVANASWMGPDIAAKGDTVYVVMKQTPEADTNSHVYLTRSFDGGSTFSIPLRVDYLADSVSRFPTVAVDDAGHPLVAFMKFNNSFLDSRWAVSRSFDYGATFQTDVEASGWSSPGSEVCDCCPGALVSDGATVAMLYRDNRNNIRDTWAGLSTDSGTTFSTGFNLDQNNWNINSCPATGPDGVIVGDTLYSVFMNGASGTLAYLSAFSLSSQTLVSVDPLTGVVPGLSQQNYPRIDHDDRALCVVWRQVLNGESQLALRFTQDITQGLPAGFDVVDGSGIVNADVALANAKVHVVWQDENDGKVKYKLGTYSPVSTGLATPAVGKSVVMAPNPAMDHTIIRLVDHSAFLAEVYGFAGNLVYASTETTMLRLDTSEFQPGTYVVVLKQAGRQWLRKLVVN